MYVVLPVILSHVPGITLVVYSEGLALKLGHDLISGYLTRTVVRLHAAAYAFRPSRRLDYF